MAYSLRFAASAEEHFTQLPARQRSIVLDAVRKQLLQELVRETRNRKPLRPNPLAPWELRAGAPRVFYEVDAEDAGVVNILSIGIKKGNRFFIAGKEIPT